jgi:glycosyltransferase involved in cell wall biosynthesis
LLHTLRRTDPTRFQWDFLLHASEAGALAPSVRDLGAKILLFPSPHRIIPYCARLAELTAVLRGYDVIHSHVAHFSSVVLGLAARAGVRARVAHSHSDRRLAESRAGRARRVCLAAARRAIRRFATAGLAASRPAAASLFGTAWEDDPRWRVLHYGRDLEDFRQPPDPAGARRELGIQGPGPVIAQVGRFVEAKNHAFWLLVAEQIARREPASRFLFIGDGPLRLEIERLAVRLGLAGRIIFAGVRSDVPRCLMGAVDVLLFPSLWEGLPLAVLEAQAAGIPVVASPAVPEEAVVIKSLVRRLDLAAPLAAWAQTVLAAVRQGRLEQSRAVAMMARSTFSMERSAATLAAFHEELCSPPRPARELEAQGVSA